MAVGSRLRKTFAALFTSPRLRETGRLLLGVDTGKTWMGIGYRIIRDKTDVLIERI